MLPKRKRFPAHLKTYFCSCHFRLQTLSAPGQTGWLAAAITLAEAGVSVTVYERNQRIGGACSTAEVTLPGFRHDLGSSVYPFGVCSPFLAALPLEEYGLRWIEPTAPLAHPFADGSALTLEYSVDETVARMPGRDSNAWRHFVGFPMRHWPEIIEGVLQPLLRVPEHPLLMARFGMSALMPASKLARLFQSRQMQALFAGCAAHSVLPLTHMGSSAAGMLLAAAAHSTGWPIAEGGAQSIADALAGYLASVGGQIVTGVEVKNLHELPAADATFFDTSVEAMADIAGPALNKSYLESLARFERGPGVFKLDWALRGPIPWKNPCVARAGTVHLGGSFEEIARSEYAAFYGGDVDKPFVLLTQPSLFDATRAPAGQHTAWAYCHVPNGSSIDRTELIERQVERFAPGFRDVVLARRASCAADLHAWNQNLVGGDITGGAMTLRQLMQRPTWKGCRTSSKAIYLCSSSTPPGGGVHGMCGHLAARAAIKDHCES